MATNKIYSVKYRRKNELRTDYKKRLKLLASHRTRIVIRSFSRSVLIQAVDFSEKGDKIVATLNSSELKNYGWPTLNANIPSAYLTGLLFGKKYSKSLKEPIIDLGAKRLTNRSKLSSAIKGISDGGIKIKFDEKILPTNEDINGTTISKYAQTLSKNKNAYEKQFSLYLKSNIKPEDLPKIFENTKNKILGK